MSRKPTIKQISALNYINQGLTKRQAMLKAGYSVGSADHPNNRLIKGKSVKGIIEEMQSELIKAGLTPEYMAGKLKEWSNSETRLQIESFSRWKEIMGLEHTKDKGLKRRISVEEFVLGSNFNDEQ